MIELKPSGRYKLPYQGAKQGISERLIEAMHNEMPEADTFIDLFGGGGSMTCHALECGYKVVYNELNSEISNLLEFCITTDFMKDYNSRVWQFLSREDFDKLKEYQPKTNKALAYKTAILLCYSFGNKMQTYICQKSKEEFKKQGHNLVIHNDIKSAEFWSDYYKDTLGKLYIEACKDYFSQNEDRFYRRSIFSKMTLKIEAITVASRYNHKIFDLYKKFNLHDLLLYSQKQICEDIDRYCPDIPKKNYQRSKNNKLSEIKQLQQLERLEQLEQLQLLQQLQQLQQLQRLSNLSNLSNLTFFSLDYIDCFNIIKNKLKPNKTIIYLDPPYKNTDTTAYKNSDSFDYDRLINFIRDLKAEGYKVFISEYTNYDNYKELLSIQVQNKMAKSKVNAPNYQTYKSEKLFINYSASEYNKIKENEAMPLLAFNNNKIKREA